jgi:hypothetical protein
MARIRPRVTLRSLKDSAVTRVLSCEAEIIACQHAFPYSARPALPAGASPSDEAVGMMD